MNKAKIRDFFDQRASRWDEDNMQNRETLSKILDNAKITEGVHVLDVACGTGILFPWYNQRKVASVTGIDLSGEMIKNAGAKFPEIKLICGDAETYSFQRIFDRIMVYNALPHFADPEALIENLTRYLAPGGIISIAHGMSREALNEYHSRHAEPVSLKLMEIAELEQKLAPYIRIITSISDGTMYQLVGVYRDSVENVL